MALKAVRIAVFGRVQGVGFRYFTEGVARSLGLVGWVRNRPDGSVEVYAEGPADRLDALHLRLREGPPLARVDRLSVSETAPHDIYERFRIEY